ncbi:hypothetical protein MKK67_11510 [Methylobacterium sp. J-072]|uniref:hypothetical protein n=1 Tax=Methylobacterium sp. J-072 TaxID=2836651 RepID=UPI001FB9F5DB|nr:hypothetical protein [Methylobacterium sp. J-072]MCJ2093118.1 hypothetical protein [Methylobacterium sp. J-072]
MQIDWSWLAERAPAAISIAKDITVAGAAISTAIVGWKALGKWRDETLGKRRLELAEDILATFYQMHEIIRNARVRVIDAREAVNEDGSPSEIAMNTYYAPIIRFHKSADKIAEFRTKRHRAAAVFGRQAVESWSAIERILTEIDIACGVLLALESDKLHPHDKNADFYVEQRRIAFQCIDDDPIEPRIVSAIQTIEAICRPIIQASVRS